jgi:hypothetical protein
MASITFGLSGNHSARAKYPAACALPLVKLLTKESVMAKIIKNCIDRDLPVDSMIEAMQKAIEENPANTPTLSARSVQPGVIPQPPLALAAITGKLWKPGRTLRVRFLDGDPVVQTRLQPFAHVWSQYANITFVFGNDPDAEIRISFLQPGSWSYIGTDALTIPKNQPTMNYGWLTKATADDEYSRVVTHEFGHSIGCIHEHQNPVADIPWDKPKVYQYYQGPPNNWTKEQVDVNLFQRYSADITQFSAFDRNSIMLYPVPNDLTIGDFEVGWNKMLSQTDEQFIATLYPFAPKPQNELTIDAPSISASIGQFGEIDTYTFVVKNAGKYRMETEGKTDVFMSLFGPSDNTKAIAQDDDSGGRLQARIIIALQPGTYTLRIRHFSAKRTGDYKIGVYTAQ